MTNQNELTVAVVVVANVMHRAVENCHHRCPLIGTNVYTERPRSVEVGDHFAFNRPTNFNVASRGSLALLFFFSNFALGNLLWRFRTLGRFNGRLSRNSLPFRHRGSGSGRLATVLTRNGDLQLASQRKLRGILHVV